MSWFKRSGSRPTSPQAAKVNMCDPEACLEVFVSHWQQAYEIMRKVLPSNSIQSQVSVTNEDIEAVLHYFTQMVALLIEEPDDNGSQGPILRSLLTENMMELLFQWCSLANDHVNMLKVEQLKIYDMIASPSQVRQQLLVHKPIIRPMLKVLNSCDCTEDAVIEKNLVLVLHHLCVSLSRNTQLLELFFNASADHGSARFLIFSLLIPYVHREENIGQQARDALLLIMALSARNEAIGKYVAENSDFCPVLATGLSGRYSTLPAKLKIPSDDWYRLEKEDWTAIPELSMFLNALEFCNAVIQIADPVVSGQLIKYIYTGFLIPVMGPALHQNSMEEVIAATAYLNLFVRQITEPSLLRAFLKFILTGQHDEINILDSLITRINSNSRLCMVSLSLFHTLVDMNCEDVMYQIVFKYLIPCTHVMVSQRRSVKDIDLYGKTAEKFLSLCPACCYTEGVEPPHHETGSVQDVNKLRPSSPVSPTSSPGKRTVLGRLFTKHDESHTPRRSSSRSPQMPVDASLSPPPPGGYVSSYKEYLDDARVKIRGCASQCECWSALYNGEDSANEMTQPLSPRDINNTKNGPVTKSSVTTMADVHTNNGTIDISRINSTMHDSSKSLNISHEDQKGKSIFVSDQKGDVCESDSKGSVNSVSSERIAARFDTQDFNEFLNTLKRVKTPVDLCKDAEESFSEMDKILDDFESVSFVTAVNEDLAKFTQTNGAKGELINPSPQLITDVNTNNSNNNNNSMDINVQSSSTNRFVKESSPLPEDLVKFDSSKSAHEALKTLPEREASAVLMNDKGAEPQKVLSLTMTPTAAAAAAATSTVSSAFSVVRPLSGTVSSFVPTKHQSGTPNIGPFLSVLLNKLESMVQNSLYINLLLTGLLTRLAYYPQPLLRSFLLNHTLVFQPTVKSLIQILGSVKQKVDAHALTVPNFDQLLLKARQYLVWRENAYLAELDGSTCSRPERSPSQTRPKAAVLEPVKEKKKPGFSNSLFRRLLDKKDKKTKAELQLTATGYRFINAKQPPTQLTKVDSLRTKNAVYCALVLEEFVKELAAISQEHAVLCPDEGYHSN